MAVFSHQLIRDIVYSIVRVIARPNSPMQKLTGTLGLSETKEVNSFPLYLHPSFTLSTTYAPSRVMWLGLSSEIGHDFEFHM